MRRECSNYIEEMTIYKYGGKTFSTKEEAEREMKRKTCYNRYKDTVITDEYGEQFVFLDTILDLLENHSKEKIIEILNLFKDEE